MEGDEDDGEGFDPLGVDPCLVDDGRWLSNAVYYEVSMGESECAL